LGIKIYTVKSREEFETIIPIVTTFGRYDKEIDSYKNIPIELNLLQISASYAI
jgi:hypothetical protein